jgi:hypothetical protein
VCWPDSCSVKRTLITRPTELPAAASGA